MWNKYLSVFNKWINVPLTSGSIRKIETWKSDESSPGVKCLVTGNGTVIKFLPPLPDLEFIDCITQTSFLVRSDLFETRDERANRFSNDSSNHVLFDGWRHWSSDGVEKRSAAAIWWKPNIKIPKTCGLVVYYRFATLHEKPFSVTLCMKKQLRQGRPKIFNINPQFNRSVFIASGGKRRSQ